MIRPPPKSTLFPSTTLFRSEASDQPCCEDIEAAVKAFGLVWRMQPVRSGGVTQADADAFGALMARSEEHTSELQSHLNLVCRLLLEKKKIIISNDNTRHSNT